MASQILAALGAKFYRKNPSTGIFEQVPQMRSVPIPEIVQAFLEGSNHDSPGGFNEYVPGLRDGGEVEANIVWNPAIAMHVQLVTDILAGTNLTWRSRLNNGTLSTWEYTAYIAQFGKALDYQTIVEMPMRLKMTANFTFTP